MRYQNLIAGKVLTQSVSFLTGMCEGAVTWKEKRISSRVTSSASVQFQQCFNIQ
jgi:hypothetical protein